MPPPEHSRLIKSNAARRIGPSSPWNCNDLERECDELVTAARTQADRLVAQARSDADELRLRASSEGHAAGRQSGLESARDEMERLAAQRTEEAATRRLATALPALDALALALARERERWLARWETSAIRLSVAIAERIIRREVRSDRAIAPQLVREALQLAAGSRSITVRMHPADLEACGPAGEALHGRIAQWGHVEWVADEAISPGGCLVETQQGQIDATIETQLDRICAELLP